jgi:hypothetical protein
VSCAKHLRAPEVGVLYFVGEKLWIDSTPNGEAPTYGDCLIHERNHIDYWAELVKTGDVPNVEYEQYPRGRVAYNKNSGNFTLLADRCVLGRKNLVRTILRRMHLPARDTSVGEDSHYQCFSCLRRRRC